MDWTTAGFLMCSIGAVLFTFLQQRKQNEEALEAKQAQIDQKEEIITEGHYGKTVTRHIEMKKLSSHWRASLSLGNANYCYGF